MDNKKKKKLFAATVLTVFLCSTLFFLKANPASAITTSWIDEETLGKMCIGQVIPTAGKKADVGSIGDDRQVTETAKENGKDAAAGENEDEKSQKNEDEQEDIKVTGDPLVIIYHTHSTESYMPYSESNYHRTDEEGTVRDVGDVLETELKKKGINVVHDKTIHDRPSYNESYGRSLDTIQALMKKYPTAEYIIDLHRDAAASSASEGKYMEIDGERVAKFSLVVGRRNENYVELYAFAKKVSQTAENMYKGFGGPIIEKEYNYNEFVSNKALLLEIGNNKNTIEETRASAKLLGDVMAEVIKGK